MTASPKALALGAAWRQLPPVVKNCLLHHSALPEARLQAGLALLSPPKNISLSHDQLSLAADLLLAAWECTPSDASLVPQLLALHQQFSFLQPAQHALFTALTCAGDSAPVEQKLAQALSPSDALWPLQCYQQAVHFFDQGDYAAALPHLIAAKHCWAGISELQGHCLLRLGRREEAFQLWRQVLTQRPWQVQLALTLHDYLRGYDAALPSPPTGGCTVLLYSWNKAPYLHNTLQALEASLPDIAQVICLNNGSTDTTADCLNAWTDRWSSRLKVLHLPVNVGAAAARNWLAALPEVRALPFAAYVDDDVYLPPDWLRHLARAVQVQPQASAWGCRILDAPPLATALAATPHSAAQPPSPPLVQSGPLHLTLAFAPPPEVPPLPGQTCGPEAESADIAFSPLRAHAEPFSVTTMPPHCIDRGQWNYIRSCASVTGCCHLFRSEDLQQQAFNLSLSPSQYDDLEYDLRALRGQPGQASGRLACYTGFCATLHTKKSGQAAGGLSAAAFGSALGNKYKLHGLFSAEDIQRMARTESTQLEQDIVQKLAFIDQHAAASA